MDILLWVLIKVFGTHNFASLEGIFSPVKNLLEKMPFHLLKKWLFQLYQILKAWQMQKFDVAKTNFFVSD